MSAGDPPSDRRGAKLGGSLLLIDLSRQAELSEVSVDVASAPGAAP